MPQKPRRTFTPDQKADAVSIVKELIKPVSQVMVLPKVKTENRVKEAEQMVVEVM